MLFQKGFRSPEVLFGIDLGGQVFAVATDRPRRVEVGQPPEPGQRRMADLVRRPGCQAMFPVGQADRFPQAIDRHGARAA